jgi:hypothetical protein
VLDRLKTSFKDPFKRVKGGKTMSSNGSPSKYKEVACAISIEMIWTYSNRIISQTDNEKRERPNLT